MNLNYVLTNDVKKTRFTISAFQKIILGFAGIILLFSLILMTPVSSKEGVWTPFVECLFTATSATCVTGLILHDTATYWSEFGQFILLLAIQIGGMGVITMGSLFVMAAKRKISLAQRSAMQESIAAPQLGGIVHYTKFVIKTIAGLEMIGAVLLTPVMMPKFGVLKGLWYSVFHSISAFCNAGFDLMGVQEPFSSLTSFAGDVYANIIFCLLIVMGGIGFLTWEDMFKYKFKLSKYRMQSKVILVTTFILLVLPGIFFYVYAFEGEAFADMTTKERVLAAAFQSVTARTAGFNTVDLSLMAPSALCIMIAIMIVGGSPGSTAGGMKTTTLAVICMSMISVFKRKPNTTCFGRRIEDDTVKNASAILVMYIVLFLTGTILLNVNEDLSLMDCAFESASAIGTVGVTLGITTSLGAVSRIVIIVMMFLGRVGGLTLIYATIAPPKTTEYKLPQEKITVG